LAPSKDYSDIEFQFRRGDSEMSVVTVSKRIAATLLFLFCILEFSYSAEHPNIAPVVTTSHGSNASSERTKPYLVLVSLDGFRFDYAQKYGAPYLTSLGKRRLAADGLIPSYPSLTFPNHYSIVTGLYPEHHGIVRMSFYDSVLGKHFSYREPKAATDGTWYRGTPLWVLAEKQGMRTACFFWPGSEAEIDGMRPTYYVPSMTHFPMKTGFGKCCNGSNYPKRTDHTSSLFTIRMLTMRATNWP